MTRYTFHGIIQEIIQKQQDVPMEEKIFSKSQINKAAQQLIQNDDVSEALQIVNSWRAAHAYPLAVVTEKLKAACSGCLIVQRVKRLESITGKLKRNPNMSLYRMQDLGGCRIICNSINEVYENKAIVERVLNEYELKKVNDYIAAPKTSGYRGIHMVYKYKDQNGFDILLEIQIRTRIQHLWATAVEIMGIYTKSQLKAGLGNEDVLRFFTFISSMFAKMENTSVCPNTSENINELLKELRRLDEKLNIISKISAAQEALKYTVSKEKYNNGYYVMQLDFSERMLHIQGFSKEELFLATKVYEHLEMRGDKNKDTVLVASDSLNDLRAAYPNYFVDISNFVEFMRKCLKES